MSYDPKTYWPERYRKEGPLACARRGMDEAASERQADAFWAAVGPRIPRPCPSLLDFGCGPGRMIRRVIRDRPDVHYWGVDQCEGAILLAEAATPLGPASGRGWRTMTRDRIPFEGPPVGGGFNCVMAVTVLQHIVDDAQFAHWCGEIARVTRPGGVAVILDGNGCHAGHCKSRTPEEVGAALGMSLPLVPGFPHIGLWALVDAESKGSHWCGTFTKSS